MLSKFEPKASRIWATLDWHRPTLAGPTTFGLAQAEHRPFLLQSRPSLGRVGTSLGRHRRICIKPAQCWRTLPTFGRAWPIFVRTSPPKLACNRPICCRHRLNSVNIGPAWQEPRKTTQLPKSCDGDARCGGARDKSLTAPQCGATWGLIAPGALRTTLRPSLAYLGQRRLIIARLGKTARQPL